MALSRRRAFGALAATSLAAPALAQTARKQWRMVTSWPKNLPGPGVSAQRLADRIRLLTQGRVDIQVFAAGEIVPAFSVLDAVGNNTVECGHSAAIYWAGKEPATAYFTTVPLGMLPVEHQAWLWQGDGQALWDECYTPFGVKPFMGGNTGTCMAGWFRRELADASALKGLKIRMVGLGAELFSRMGATAMAISVADIYPALEKGTVDAAEFTTPGSDLQLGLGRVAPFYYAPAFNKPNGTSEFLVNEKVWEQLDSETKAIIAEACNMEAALALSEMEMLNIAALQTMIGQQGVQLRAFTPDILALGKSRGLELMQEVAARSKFSRKVTASYNAFQARVQQWTRLASGGTISAREG